MSRIEPENCFVVYPHRDNWGSFELVLADPGAAGHAAIAKHYPDLKLALDADELGNVQQVAMNAPMFKAWPYWGTKPNHFLFVVIKDNTPVAKLLVEATSASKAIRKAAKVAPGCTFNIVGLLAHFIVAGNAIMAILDGDTALASVDLRTQGEV